MQKYFIPITIIVVLFMGMAALSFFNHPELKHVHYHAGFQVYVNGKQVDFAKPEYMHEKPCTVAKNVEHEDEQIEKAHLHELVGDVVHVHREPVYWSDLFTNLKYSFDTSKPMSAYINGKKAPDFLSVQIHPYDSLIVLVGSHGNSKSYLKNEVTKQYIQSIEKHSEQCGI